MKWENNKEIKSITENGQKCKKSIQDKSILFEKIIKNNKHLEKSTPKKAKSYIRNKKGHHYRSYRH